MTALLAIRDLSVELAAAPAPATILDRASLDLEAGEARALVGESGGGKTMLARAILRLLPAGMRISAGSIHLRGEDLLGLPERSMESRRGGAIGYVFQEPLSALDPVRPVGAQVAEAVRLHSSASPRGAAARAVELLDEVGLPAPARRFHDYPHQLSGGMRQRAVIAAALGGNPAVLIADEPTASLDPPLAVQVLDLLDGLRRGRGLALLLVTHDLRMAAQRCDRISVLYAGRIVEESTAAEFAAEPRHPYAAALAACGGRAAGGRAERLPVIAGIAPPLSERSAPRCTFAPRCPRVFDRCEVAEPPPYAAGEGRVRCFLYAPEAA